MKNLTNLYNVCDYNTGNAGFDILRNKHAGILTANGFDIVAAYNNFTSKSLVKQLIKEKHLKVVVIGCNILILSDGTDILKVRTMTHASFTCRTPTYCGTAHTYDYDVNQVINDRLQWLPLNKAYLIKQLARKYKLALVAGLDIIPQEVLNNSYKTSKLDKTLSTHEKRLKYN